jgi:hypothetical protein
LTFGIGILLKCRFWSGSGLVSGLKNLSVLVGLLKKVFSCRFPGQSAIYLVFFELQKKSQCQIKEKTRRDLKTETDLQKNRRLVGVRDTENRSVSVSVSVSHWALVLTVAAFIYNS